MGKRYKRGNHGRKKPIIVNDFFAREQLLNKHINHFINSYFNLQLTRFKYYYTKWKKLTYYIYLEQRFDVPKHLCSALEFFINISNDINSTIYRL